ncbi:hypothetical protein WDW89_11635 [Deltaproteobacteria bacterium TL4]
MEKVANPSKITREEIEKAIQLFLSKEKKVRVLPPEKVINRTMIGGVNWGPYETFDDLNYGN